MAAEVASIMALFTMPLGFGAAYYMFDLNAGTVSFLMDKMIPAWSIFAGVATMYLLLQFGVITLSRCKLRLISCFVFFPAMVYVAIVGGSAFHGEYQLPDPEGAVNCTIQKVVMPDCGTPCNVSQIKHAVIGINSTIGRECLEEHVDRHIPFHNQATSKTVLDSVYEFVADRMFGQLTHVACKSENLTQTFGDTICNPLNGSNRDFCNQSRTTIQYGYKAYTQSARLLHLVNQSDRCVPYADLIDDVNFLAPKFMAAWLSIFSAASPSREAFAVVKYEALQETLKRLVPMLASRARSAQLNNFTTNGGRTKSESDAKLYRRAVQNAETVKDNIPEGAYTKEEEDKLTQSASTANAEMVLLELIRPMAIVFQFILIAGTLFGARMNDKNRGRIATFYDKNVQQIAWAHKVGVLTSVLTYPVMWRYYGFMAFARNEQVDGMLQLFVIVCMVAVLVIATRRCMSVFQPMWPSCMKSVSGSVSS